MKILVIENDEEMRLLLCQALALEGFESAAFPCCSAAITEMRCEQYDLAIIDLGLPIVSGISCAEKIRFECPEMYLIAYTAYTEATEPEYLLKQAGFNACFRKGESHIKLINEVVRYERMGKAQH